MSMSHGMLRYFRICLTLVWLFPLQAHAAYYANTAGTFNWVDPVASGHTAVTWSNCAQCTGFCAARDDDITVLIALPFSFNFGGTGYASLRIQTNGRLQFSNQFCGWGTQTVGPPPTYPWNYPNANVVRTIRIYGADFDPGASAPAGQVYYGSDGIAPNRRFIVTWKDIREWNSPGSLFNVQIILHENGEFVFQYKDTVNLTTGHAQIGWEVSTIDYDIYNYSGFGTLAYSAIRFYPQPVKTGEWRMDEVSWTGAAGEVIDSSGNGYHAQSQNGAITSLATPALPGNPGTCRYGVFDGINHHVLLPAAFPNLNQSFTITAWIRTQDRTRSGQRIFIDDENNSGGYGFSLGDGGAGRIRFFKRGGGTSWLDTSPVIQNNLWYFAVAVADIANSRIYLYVYDASGALLETVNTAFAGWGTDAGRASIGGETNASAESAFKFFGDIDEVKVYSGAVPQSTLDVLARETHLCPLEGATLGGFNVFESSTPAGSVAGYIKTKVAGRRFDLSTGNLAIVALTPADAIDTAFTGTVRVELLDASAGGALDANGCNAAWPLVATLANQTFGVGSNGRINMNPIPQVNNAAYPNLKVRVSYPTVAPTRIGCSNDSFALRPDNLVANNATHVDWQTPGAGPALNNTSPVGGQVHKAGRDFSLSAQARDALGNNIANYSGSPAGGVSALLLPSGCGACVPGTVTVGGWSGAGLISSNSANYSEAGAIAMHIEDRSFANVDSADSSAGERYIDSNVVSVGRFVPDHFDVAQLVSPLFMTFNATDAQCSAGVAPRRTFTYIGQPFGYVTRPQATIIARNFAGATTANYRGALWKIGGAGAATKDCTTTPNTCVYTTSFGATGGAVAETYTYTLDTGATPGWDNGATQTVPAAATVTSNSDGTGTISYASSDLIAFLRSTAAPQAEFVATINNSISAIDNAEGAGQIITTTNPAAFNGILFDAPYVPLAQPNKFFYGRLRLENANGSQLLSMPIPLKAQRWNGTAFITNDLDNCTTVALNNVALGNYQRNLNAGETTPTVGGAFSAGIGSLRLSAPGQLNDGSVDVSGNLTALPAGASCPAGMPVSTPSALSYLQGAWCGANYDDDPTARATFGVYRNANQFIYQRENF